MGNTTRIGRIVEWAAKCEESISNSMFIWDTKYQKRFPSSFKKALFDSFTSNSESVEAEGFATYGWMGEGHHDFFNFCDGLGITRKSPMEDGVCWITVEFREDEVLEYARTMDRPPLDKSFQLGFREGVYCYQPASPGWLGTEMFLYFVTHEKEFKRVDAENGKLLFVPVEKPSGLLATDTQAGLKFLADKMVEDDIDDALEIAYGGRWFTAVGKGPNRFSTLVSELSTKMVKDINGSDMAAVVKKDQLTVTNMLDYLANVEEQNKKLGEMLIAAGSEDNFLSKLSEDVVKSIHLKAVNYTDSESHNVRSLAKLALRGCTNE